MTDRAHIGTAPAPSATRIALFTVPAILGIGFLMGRISNSGYGNDWFDALQKPAAMPPGWLFGAAWSVLYVLLGIAIALILAAPKSKPRDAGIALFALQLALNFSWSPIFFGLHKAQLALSVIAAMLVLSIGAAIAFAKVRPAASLLMIPYLAWLCFATYLNFEIVALNPVS